MPAEWEPHAATWLSWPRREGISFPDAFDRVMPTFREMVAALIESEPVCINVCNGAHEAEARAVLNGLPNECITYYEIPTNEPWCRDHGPIFLTRDEDPKLAIVDWDYNAWGGKYPPFDLDDVVPTRIGAALELPVYNGGMILEGGSIDVNGAGALPHDRVVSAESESQSEPIARTNRRTPARLSRSARNFLALARHRGRRYRWPHR